MGGAGVPRKDLLAIVRDLEKEMKRLAKELQYEDAARVSDRSCLLRRRLSGEEQPESKEDDNSEVSLAIARSPSRGRWFGTGSIRAAVLDLTTRKELQRS